MTISGETLDFRLFILFSATFQPRSWLDSSIFVSVRGLEDILLNSYRCAVAGMLIDSSAKEN